VQLTIQQKDAAADNERCKILRGAFVPILDNISKYNCPSIVRNTLWVALAIITLSGGSMFTIRDHKTIHHEIEEDGAC